MMDSNDDGVFFSCGGGYKTKSKNSTNVKNE